MYACISERLFVQTSDECAAIIEYRSLQDELNERRKVALTCLVMICRKVRHSGKNRFGLIVSISHGISVRTDDCSTILKSINIKPSSRQDRILDLSPRESLRFHSVLPCFFREEHANRHSESEHYQINHTRVIYPVRVQSFSTQASLVPQMMGV